MKDQAGWPPYQPEKGEWIWRDADDNGEFDAGEYQANGGEDSPSVPGWWVDRAGNVWRATETKGIRFFPSQGLDVNGSPKGDFKTLRTFPRPEGFKMVKRLRYDSASDTLYMGGTTAEAENQHWKPMGPMIACYDGWLNGAQKLRWRVTLPYSHGASGHESCEPMGFDVADDFIFVQFFRGQGAAAGPCIGDVAARGFHHLAIGGERGGADFARGFQAFEDGRGHGVLTRFTRMHGIAMQRNQRRRQRGGLRGHAGSGRCGHGRKPAGFCRCFGAITAVLAPQIDEHVVLVDKHHLVLLRQLPERFGEG